MEEVEDSFQRLPDELLTEILRWLPLEEAATTSLVSKRWRYAWRDPTNPHFDGDKITKFRSDGYPVSYFESLHDFYTWIDETIGQRECSKETGFWIESLGLNFKAKEDEDEDEDSYGWIEFRNSDDSLIIGGYRVVRLLSLRTTPEINLSDVLSRRPHLLKNLTLRYCDMKILTSRLVFTSDGDSFRSLESLVLDCGGKELHLDMVASFIIVIPSLMTIVLEQCTLTDDDEGLPISRVELSLSPKRLLTSVRFSD